MVRVVTTGEILNILLTLATFANCSSASGFSSFLLRRQNSGLINHSFLYKRMVSLLDTLLTKIDIILKATLRCVLIILRVPDL